MNPEHNDVPRPLSNEQPKQVGGLLRRASLGPQPELHLDVLLSALHLVPDGHETEQEAPDTWQASVAGYFVKIRPDHICGFAEEGDGKILTVLTGRIAENGGMLTLTTRAVVHPPTDDLMSGWVSTAWTAVTLGPLMPWHAEVKVCPRHRHVGVGENDMPGVAVLLAYLQAWGVLE